MFRLDKFIIKKTFFLFNKAVSNGVYLPTNRLSKNDAISFVIKYDLLAVIVVGIIEQKKRPSQERGWHIVVGLY